MKTVMKGSNWLRCVLFGVSVTILLCVLGAAIGSWLMVNGSVDEQMGEVTTYIVMGCSLLAGLILAGSSCGECQFKIILLTSVLVFVIEVMFNILTMGGGFELIIPNIMVMVPITVLSLLVCGRKKKQFSKRMKPYR